MMTAYRARTSRRPKTALFLWRYHAGLTQDELGHLLGLGRTRVAEYETGERPLVGEGLLIIRWAHYCKLDPGSSAVQGLLYETGNAPLIPDPNCTHCKETLSQCATDLFHEHPQHRPRPSPPEALRRALRFERARGETTLACTHPYTNAVNIATEE